MTYVAGFISGAIAGGALTVWLTIAGCVPCLGA